MSDEEIMKSSNVNNVREGGGEFLKFYFDMCFCADT